MGLSVFTAATENPITTAELKAHSHIDTSADDAEIAALVSAASQDTEAILWRQLCTATYTLTLDRFPADDYIDLPRPPLASVTHVKYYDNANTQQTLSSALYEVDTSTEPGRIYIDRSDGWPSVYDRRNAVEIRFVAGYGAAAAVPEGIKQIIRMKAAHWYENREASIVGVSAMSTPLAVERLENLYKFRGELNIYARWLTSP
jgi:uncharacterized phiE125 gp8 family phage protein